MKNFFHTNKAANNSCFTLLFLGGFARSCDLEKDEQNIFVFRKLVTKNVNENHKNLIKQKATFSRTL